MRGRKRLNAAIPFYSDDTSDFQNVANLSIILLPNWFDVNDWSSIDSFERKDFQAFRTDLQHFHRVQTYRIRAIGRSR